MRGNTSKSRRAIVFVMLIASLMAFMLPVVMDNNQMYDVYANGVEDTIGSGGNTIGNIGDQIAQQPLSPDDQDMVDWISGQRGVTGEQLETASQLLSPVTAIIGYVTGAILVLTITFVTLITALDLLYIAIPPVRNLLYKAGTDGTGAYTGGMAAGGFQGGMGGIGGAAGGTAKPTQWVSDEAVACAALIGGSAQTQPAMGMGGMGMGGMPMGAPGMSPNGGAATPGKTYPLRTVIGMYFKKRVVFMILLGLCIIVLTSSILMDTGVNIARWFLKLMGMLNSQMGG